MAGFVGRYEHSLDTKGRVILPAKFRGQFERGGYLTQNSEGCLALWTPGEFERQMEHMQERAGSSRADRNRARIWASNSAEVEIDRQGRMPIPAHLRTFAHLDAEVLVHGAIDRVELWNPAALGRAGAAGGELAAPGGRGVAPAGADGATNARSKDRTEERNDARTQRRSTTDTTEQHRTHRTMCSSSTGTLEGHSTHLLAGRPDLHLPLDPPAEGLQMAHSFEHIPVLRDEVVSLFASVPPGTVVDATVGGGGHAAALLEAYPGLRVVGLDRDPAALEAARARLSTFGDRVSLVARPFSSLPEIFRGPFVRAPLGGSLRPRRELAPARSGGAGLLVPGRRAARHADGPDHGRDRRRPGEQPAGGVSRRAVPGERRGATVRAYRPRGRGIPATDLHEAAGRSRVIVGAGGGPSQGTPGAPGVPGPAHRSQRRAGATPSCAACRAVAPGRRGSVRGDQLPLGRGPPHETDVRRRGLWRLRLPSGPALRVWCRRPAHAGVPGCAQAGTVRGGIEPTRRECSTACHRPDRSGPGPRTGAKAPRGRQRPRPSARQHTAAARVEPVASLGRSWRRNDATPHRRSGSSPGVPGPASASGVLRSVVRGCSNPFCRLDRRGALVGRRRRTGAPGQRPGETVGPPARARTGAERAPPERTGSRPARDAVSYRGRRLG